MEIRDGVYSMDKKAIKKMIADKLTNQNTASIVSLEKVIDDSEIEIMIDKDSVVGMTSISNHKTILNANLEVIEDSISIRTAHSIFSLIPTKTGLLFKKKSSRLAIPLIKTDQTTLSIETKSSVKRIHSREKQLVRFNEELGNWRTGNLSNQLGESVEQNTAFTYLKANYQNPIGMSGDLYVKASIYRDNLYFKIFNNDMTSVVAEPASSFGNMNIVFPNGEMRSEKVYFYKNFIREVPDDKIKRVLQHLLNSSGAFNITIEQNFTSENLTNKIQFTIDNNSLGGIMEEISDTQ